MTEEEAQQIVEKAQASGQLEASIKRNASAHIGYSVVLFHKDKRRRLTLAHAQDWPLLQHLWDLHEPERAHNA
jgi:hypothetical protein